MLTQNLTEKPDLVAQALQDRFDFLQRKDKYMALTRSRRPGKIRIRKKTIAAFIDALPTEMEEAADDMSRFAMLWYGKRKVGKTGTLQHDPDSFTIQYDKKQHGRRRREVVPKSWGDFLDVLTLLEEASDNNAMPYTTVGVDGVAEWYQHCMDYVSKKAGVEYPGDANDHGKTWNAVKREFTDAVNRVLMLSCGVVFICHDKTVELVDDAATVGEKIVPYLPAACSEVVNSKVDGWFYFAYHGSRRVLNLLGDEGMDAGHRIEGRFRTKDGRPVRQIDMGSSPEESRRNLKVAFDNEQTYATMEEFLSSRRSNKKKGAARRKKTLSK